MLPHTKAVLVIALLILLPLQAAALLPAGDIVVHSTPPGAYACIDGNSDCGYTTATFVASADAWHTVDVTKDGYLHWSDSVYVTSGQTSVVVADLQLNPDATKIQVYVNPGGGQVCLDNRECHVDVGTSSGIGSTQFTGVDVGPHTISVVTDGYRPATEQVYVSLGATSTIHMELVPVTTPSGSIQVLSTPAGASACVDGGICLQTPGTFSGLNSGTYHTVEISLPGYETYTENSYVVVGQTSIVRANLLPVSSQTGSIRVYVDVPGSTVCLDTAECHVSVGGTSGTGTATTEFTGVSAGVVHTVSVEADGYEPYTAPVMVNADQVNTVDVSLHHVATETPGPTLTETTIPTPTLLPTTRAGLSGAPVLGALVLWGIVAVVRRSRR